MRCPCGSGLSVGNCQHYKEGDRVEAIKPPTGVEDSQADQIGLGEITAINLGEQNGETHKVMLDSGEEWWYSEDRLRLVTAAKPTPTPSITVGTQVRLTGVVTKVTSNGIGVSFGEAAANDALIYSASILEVIRQPFKRGEVVYSCGAISTGIAFQVLGDETDSGDVLLIKESNEGGNKSFVAHHSDFERRKAEGENNAADL